MRIVTCLAVASQFQETLSIIKASAKSPVLQVALVAKQAFSRREPSSCQSWDDPLLSLLEVLRPREEGRSTLLSLEREAAADDDAALLSLLAGVLLCHDVVAAHAQCKDEASEYTRFERHGNADTPELKSVPEWLEEKLAKTLEP
eukprot:s4178_g6.t1